MGSFRADPPPKQITASGFVRAIRAEARSFSRRHSLSAPSASRLVIGVIVLADADPPLGQPCHPNLASADEAATGRLANAVEDAPLLEGQDALRSVGCVALALPALSFAESHERTSIAAASGGKAPDGRIIEGLEQ
jgi:hypothetical protein